MIETQPIVLKIWWFDKLFYKTPHFIGLAKNL